MANDCPDTLGNFISPREHGLKIFVYLTGEEPEALRAELNALGNIDLPTLERYHHRMFALAADKYQKLLNTKVDTSGSDLSRGVFVSHDPDAFLSLERLENVKPLTITLTLPTEEESKRRNARNLFHSHLSSPHKRTRPRSTCKCSSTSAKLWNTPNGKNASNRQPRQLLLLPRQPVLPPPHHGSGHAAISATFPTSTSKRLCAMPTNTPRRRIRQKRILRSRKSSKSSDSWTNITSSAET